MLINKNSYVIEDTHGARWYFSFEPDEGIRCIKRPDGANASSSENLVNTGSDDFSADIDRDYIYLLYKGTNNELNLMIWNGSIWSKSSLMKNPVTGNIKRPNLLLDNGFIHILYEVNNKDNNYYLVHHFWNKNKWSTNVIVSSDSSIPYCFTRGPSGLYGIYSYRGELRYLNFTYTSGTWGKPITIGNTDSKDDFFIHVGDKYSGINIIYSGYKKLHYIKKASGNWPSNNEQNKILFSDGAQHPSLLYIGTNLWAVWHSEGFLYTCLSADNGDTWSKPFKISSAADTLSVCNFISLEKGFIRAKAFYHIKNPYCLILIDDIFEPQSSGFSYFTIYINQIQQYIDQLSKKVQEQNDKNNELIKNLQKIESYYKDLNTQYNMLKSSYGNILHTVDNLKSENENLKSENINLKNELKKAKSNLLRKLFSLGRS